MWVDCCYQPKPAACLKTSSGIIDRLIYNRLPLILGEPQESFRPRKCSFFVYARFWQTTTDARGTPFSTSASHTRAAQPDVRLSKCSPVHLVTPAPTAEAGWGEAGRFRIDPKCHSVTCLVLWVNDRTMLKGGPVLDPRLCFHSFGSSEREREPQTPEAPPSFFSIQQFKTRYRSIHHSLEHKKTDQVFQSTRNAAISV